MTLAVERAVKSQHKQKKSMHIPSLKADLSDGMEMIVQLAKKSVILCHVFKQRMSDTADSPCPTKSMTPISYQLWFQNLNSFYDNNIFTEYIRSTG